jgi:ABC-type transport system involved in cytochrome c biogenesis permease component
MSIIDDPMWPVAIIIVGLPLIIAVVIFGATVIAAVGARNPHTRRHQLSILAEVIRCIAIIRRRS